ncbi:MAG TPA: hypothetical protein VGI81_11975 [Tepidisphaeraceae bacterium]|jgi:hypothetical protein
MPRPSEPAAPSVPPGRSQIPLWITIPFTLYAGVLVPIYWRDYGPANFLWFCDMGMLMTLAGLWLNSPLLISIEAIALALPQTVWIVDFVSGGRLIGISHYMFESGIPLFTRLISTFHIWLPILLVWLIWQIGYDRRAVWIQSIIAAAVLIASYLLSDPRHPPTGYPDVAVNVNRVYGVHTTDVQHWMPPLAFLALHILFWPLCVYLPTHLIFRKAFREPAHGSDSSPATIAPQVVGER